MWSSRGHAVAVAPLLLLLCIGALRRAGGSLVLTRRAAAVHQGAAALALLSPAVARADLGQTGALDPNLPQSATGDAVQILLTDLAYKELEACPPNFYLPTKGGPWDCIEIRGTAINQGKRDVTAAAVFGLVRDAEGYACLATALDPSIKTGIASLGAVPRGKTPVSFVVAVQGRSPRPLQLTGFKASYRNAAIEKTFAVFDPCEIDSSQCADDEEQPGNSRAARARQ